MASTNPHCRQHSGSRYCYVQNKKHKLETESAREKSMPGNKVEGGKCKYLMTLSSERDEEKQNYKKQRKEL